MIKIFNSAYPGTHRMISIDDVTVREVKLNCFGEPRMIFAHKDYPLGDLYAEFRDGVWLCDMD